MSHTRKTPDNHDYFRAIRFKPYVHLRCTFSFCSYFCLSTSASLSSPKTAFVGRMRVIFLSASTIIARRMPAVKRKKADLPTKKRSLKPRINSGTRVEDELGHVLLSKVCRTNYEIMISLGAQYMSISVGLLRGLIASKRSLELD
jgi:hypothetical protein